MKQIIKKFYLRICKISYDTQNQIEIFVCKSCIVGYFCCLICQPSKLNHKSSCHGQYQVQDIYKCRHANPKQVFKAPDHYKCYWYSYIHAYKRIEKLNPTKKTERTKKKTPTSPSSTKGKLDFKLSCRTSYFSFFEDIFQVP